MSESTKATVFRILNIEKHPHADRLGIVNFYNYQCIVRLGDFSPGDLAVYIPPDSLVDLNRPEFSFLKAMNKGNKIKSQKLRGIVSQGLVIPAPNNRKVGDDVTEELGIGHYNPPEPVEQTVNPPKSRLHRFLNKLRFEKFAPVPKYRGNYYDIESWYRYSDIFTPKDTVVVTEKVHGMNARYTYQNGKFHVCSRKIWRANDGGNIYSQILKENKWLQNLCKLNPNYIIYGEIYGPGIQKEINYFVDKPQFRIFDIYDPLKDAYVAWDLVLLKVKEALSYIPWYTKLANWLFGPQNVNGYDSLLHPMFCVAPVDYIGKYDEELIKSKISSQSHLTSDIREGIVIKTVTDIRDIRFGRKILKAVSPEYEER